MQNSEINETKKNGGEGTQKSSLSRSRVLLYWEEGARCIASRPKDYIKFLNISDVSRCVGRNDDY